MFESCYTPDDVAYVLRHRYGFPIELVARRPSVTCGHHLGAIAVPMELGYRAVDLLADRQAAPVVANPRNTVWTFLVAPALTPICPGQHRRLAGHGIVVHDRGHRVLMPVSDGGFGWRWAREPAVGALCLPSRAEVLDTVDLVLRMAPVSWACR